MIPNKVFILLGTNLGDREKNLNKAIDEIEAICIEILTKSSVFETAPWGFDSDQLFLNQVVMVETNLNAFELLDGLMKIENQMGRIRKETGYHSRTIDLDILYFNSDIIQNEQLTIPHPRMHTRNFTMVPMVEIAPHFIHPKLHCSQKEILDKLVDKNEVHLYKSTGERKD
jgi:2-amino-4-hydroxy-6-hydroxymethyldihydropteridine diphosphokinase